jgi:2-iminobutanoate/2-iminopropanoate deaminase
MKLDFRTAWISIALLASVGCRGAGTEHTEARGALGPYSAMVRAGDFVFVSGKTGARRESFEDEVESAIDALETELARVDLTLADVVSVTVYATDMQRYGDVNAIYARRFSEPYPARAFVAVSALPGGASFEIQAVARTR